MDWRWISLPSIIYKQPSIENVEVSGSGSCLNGVQMRLGAWWWVHCGPGRGPAPAIMTSLIVAEAGIMWEGSSNHEVIEMIAIINMWPDPTYHPPCTYIMCINLTLNFEFKNNLYSQSFKAFKWVLIETEKYDIDAERLFWISKNSLMWISFKLKVISMEFINI